jgi:ribonuclease Z
MNDFKVTILGNGSAVPTALHHPSSQLVQYLGRQYLIDCGEGTQMQMIKYKLKRKNLDHIFISHLHGDHFYGLIGIINSFHLLKRNRPLHIYASKDLESLIDFQLKITNTKLVYPLVFHFLKENKVQVLYEDKFITINAFPLKHTVASWGFKFTEKEGRRRIKKRFIKDYKPTTDEIRSIIEGGNYKTKDGQVLDHHEITHPPQKTRSFAYCSDTAYSESTAKYVKGVDLLYHESTFNNANRDLANQTLHSTAQDAARIGKKAGVRKLLIGHYSARYKDLDELIAEARAVFPESIVSEEGVTYEL